MPEKLTDISVGAAAAVSPPPQADSRAAVALPPASGSKGAPERNLRRLRRVGSSESVMGNPVVVIVSVRAWRGGGEGWLSFDGAILVDLV
jgi:hypothetical protein